MDRYHSRPGPPDMVNALDREAASKQTNCYTCGKKFDRVTYECPICGERQCSDECRAKHVKAMDEAYA
jgi:predicted RNA-binding Zn-ribbon protein involved in translation (DUF1610 family)